MRSFTEEQVMFREAYRKFIEQEIKPNMADWRKAGIVDRSAFKKAGDQGFLMIWPDEKFVQKNVFPSLFGDISSLPIGKCKIFILLFFTSQPMTFDKRSNISSCVSLIRLAEEPRGHETARV